MPYPEPKSSPKPSLIFVTQFILTTSITKYFPPRKTPSNAQINQSIPPNWLITLAFVPPCETSNKRRERRKEKTGVMRPESVHSTRAPPSAAYWGTRRSKDDGVVVGLGAAFFGFGFGEEEREGSVERSRCLFSLSFLEEGRLVLELLTLESWEENEC